MCKGSQYWHTSWSRHKQGIYTPFTTHFVCLQDCKVQHPRKCKMEWPFWAPVYTCIHILKHKIHFTCTVQTWLSRPHLSATRKCPTSSNALIHMHKRPSWWVRQKLTEALDHWKNFLEQNWLMCVLVWKQDYRHKSGEKRTHFSYLYHFTYLGIPASSLWLRCQDDNWACTVHTYYTKAHNLCDHIHVHYELFCSYTTGWCHSPHTRRTCWHSNNSHTSWSQC